MPTNLKKFTKELKEKNALIRKIAQATAVKHMQVSREFPLTSRMRIYEWLPTHVIVNQLSKLSMYDRNLIVKSNLLKKIKKECYTLVVDKKT